MKELNIRQSPECRRGHRDLKLREKRWPLTVCTDSTVSWFLTNARARTTVQSVDVVVDTDRMQAAIQYARNAARSSASERLMTQRHNPVAHHWGADSLAAT